MLQKKQLHLRKLKHNRLRLQNVPAMTRVSVVVSNVAKTALIGMVQQIETTGVTSVRDGFRLGWSRHAWRNFLMEFVVGLAAFFVAIFIAILIVTLGIGTGAAFTVNNTAGGSMVAVLVVTVLLLIPILLVVGFIVSGIQSFASRYIVLREAHVFDSLASGWQLFRANFVNVGLMMLLLFALTIVWGILSGLLGVMTGGLLGVAVGFGAYALTQSIGASILAALPGILLAIVLMS